MLGIAAWRHMRGGEPAAVGDGVSLDSSQQGATGDRGDIYYVRSTDAGVTWATPVKLNTDTGTAMQCQPSLTATAGGVLFASWYEQRAVNGGAHLNRTPGASSPNCCRRWRRSSFDQGGH